MRSRSRRRARRKVVRVWRSRWPSSTCRPGRRARRCLPRRLRRPRAAAVRHPVQRRVHHDGLHRVGPAVDRAGRGWQPLVDGGRRLRASARPVTVCASGTGSLPPSGTRPPLGPRNPDRGREHPRGRPRGPMGGTDLGPPRPAPGTGAGPPHHLRPARPVQHERLRAHGVGRRCGQPSAAGLRRAPEPLQLHSRRLVAGVLAVQHRVESGRWDGVATPRSLQAAATSLGLGDAAFIAYRPPPLTGENGWFASSPWPWHGAVDSSTRASPDPPRAHTRARAG